MAIHSVSDVTKYIKGMFSREALLQGLLVRGEVSNFKRYASGHCYFTLKDALASMKCVMFRSRAQNLRFQPENGMCVVAGGSISVYERDGVYQLYVDSLAPEGAGELALAFEQRKARLMAEGLFDETHKKAIPAFPRRIGVVTSSSGAVLRDIYRVSKRRNPRVQLILFPSQVQGDGAAEQIAEGIRFFNEKYPVDVLIVGRGGGSMEDLWAFNEEVLVRAIFASGIPVISAVGHETDFTLADFVSDLRAATPSQAAELAVPDSGELLRHIRSLQARLQTAARRGLQEKRSRLEACRKSTFLANPQNLLFQRQQRLDTAMRRLGYVAREQIREKRHRFDVQLEKMDMLNPARVLRRGYSIVEHEGGLLHSIKEVHEGSRLRLILADGELQATVDRLGKAGK